MKANKCEEYCGTCYPLTITVDGRQFVYRYGSAKNRRVGLGMLRTKYPNKKTVSCICVRIAERR